MVDASVHPTAQTPTAAWYSRCAHTLGAAYVHACEHCSWYDGQPCDLCMPCSREECQWAQVPTPLHLRAVYGPTLIGHCDEGCHGEAAPPRADHDVPLGQLCRVCDAAAPHRCGRCHVARYCSREHQAVDWATHRQSCMRNTVL
jgi:hypothetical protein